MKIKNVIKDNLKKLFKNNKYQEISFEKMWFLNKSIDSYKFPKFVSKALLDIKENGFTIIKNNLTDEECDAVIKDFDEFTSSQIDSEKYRDDHGLHERLCNLHLVSKAARRICFNKNVSDIIHAAFLEKFILVGSLFFEKGSAQSIHRDTPAFFTNPLNHFLGIWNALEDIKPGSGPLIYYPKGHKILEDKDLYLNKDIKINNYFKNIELACIKAGLEKIEYYPNKGDTLIWHPQLPHGGFNKFKKGFSRKSFVYHCIPDNTLIYGTDLFFESRKRLPIKQLKTLNFSGNIMLDQIKPRFFHNYLDGNFDEL